MWIQRFLTLALIGLSSMETVGQSVGLVLSGGGVKSMAHIGALKALEEAEIPIDFIVGTSGGALVGALYASGYSPSEIEKLLTSPDFIRRASGEQSENSRYFFAEKDADASIAGVNISLDSTLHTRIPSNIVNTAEIDFTLMRAFSAASAISGGDFDQLMIPFRCLASDITEKKPVVFKKTDLAMAVRASMAFPFYFPPVVIGSHLYFDGGIYDNFPQKTMLDEFNPDVLIGVNASDEMEQPFDGNFLSQLKSMIQQPQQHDKIRAEDILIKPDFASIGTLDFKYAKAAIDSGYVATRNQLAEIQSKITNRTGSVVLTKKRTDFTTQQHTTRIGHIQANGLSAEQNNYVVSTLNPKNKPLDIAAIERNWYRLTSDQNISYIYPVIQSTSNPDSSILEVQASPKRGLDLEFGGIVSSRPVNTGFVSAKHSFWAQQCLNLYGNLYFGKLYNSGLVTMRLDIPGRLPLQVEPSASISQTNYFKSSSTFYSDLKPSFLIQQERIYGLSVSTPLRNNGKLTASIQSFTRKDNYYLTRSFSVSDTADITRLDGFTAKLTAQRNTLNRKMYPNKGQLLRLDVRGFIADETTTPGSTGIITDTTTALHQWLQLNAKIDQYIEMKSWLRFGYTAELQFSGMPFLSNQYATSSVSPAFQPLTEMQTLYLERFRSHNFLGLGLRSIFLLADDIDIRAEGYMFQPFQEILPKADLKGTYGNAFSKRYFAASLNTVYQSPVGPISLALNYIDGRENPVSVMFHLGYLLFNRKIIQD
ncbi:MAG: patatin-like phospholipase family protein [Bacteroidota bacterium]|jgi:NTE family protein